MNLRFLFHTLILKAFSILTLNLLSGHILLRNQQVAAHHCFSGTQNGVDLRGKAHLAESFAKMVLT